MRQLFLSAIIAALPLSLAAYTLKGRVAEKQTNESLPLATYHIFTDTDSINPIVNDITDEAGVFATELPDGNYRLALEYVSKQPYYRDFSIVGSDLNLGDLLMEEMGEELQEVTVVARKDLISSDGATLTYDVERDPASGTSTILEMLRKVPMVTVDGEDNIKVKGNSNFKIYINGKPDPLLSGDPSTVLKSMPASSIKKIEVITDPGAKYDAEGVAGILNIIMDKKQSLEGYNVNARLAMGMSGISGSLYGRTKLKNVTVSAQCYYNNQGDLFRSANSYSSSERTDFENEKEHKYTSKSVSNGRFMNVGGNINLSWEPDTLNLFTVSLRYYKGHYYSKVTQENRMADIADATVWSYNRDFKTYNNWHGFVPYFSYQHTFPNNSKHYLTFSYELGGGGSSYDAFQNSFDFVGMSLNATPLMKTGNEWTVKEHTLQADYSLPITDKQTFEAGAKALFRHPGGTSGYYGGEQADDMAVSTLYKMTQINDLWALYSSYSASFGKFSTRVGVRYEHSRMGLRYHEQIGVTNPDFTTNLNDVIPNASFTYKITEGSNLRAAYSMRIERPYIGQLNPAVNDLTYGSLTYGNPNLKTAHANNLELKYSNYGGKFSGEASVTYSRTNDAVGQLSFMKEGVEHTTYENLGHNETTFLHGYLAYQISSAMDFGINLSAHYTDARSDKGQVPLHSHGWSYNVNGNYSYTTPFKMRVDAWGGYGTGGTYLQNKGSDWYYWGFSLSRSFLANDLLTVSVNAQDLFPVRWKSKSTQTTPTSITVNRNNTRNWSLGCTISVRFGNLRQDVKRTNAQINNNDGVSGGSTGGK